MGIFKEEHHLLMDLANRQRQILNDSCYLGLNRFDMTQDELDRLRETIKTLLQLPGSRLTWSMDEPAVQRSYRLVIMWGGNGQGKYDATIYEVSYYKGRRGEFFMIDNIRHQVVNKEGE